jgi:tRNA1(Val) A37 N6-methylase TrmN6
VVATGRGEVLGVCTGAGALGLTPDDDSDWCEIGSVEEDVVEVETDVDAR